MTRCIERGDHQPRHFLSIFENVRLPDPNHPPPGCLKQLRDFPISRGVAGKLRHPPFLALATDCRPKSLLVSLDERACVPEVAVHEEDGTESGKDQVGPARKTRPMKAVAKAT